MKIDSILDIQMIPDQTYDELWSKPIDHLNQVNERRKIIRLSKPIELLDCKYETINDHKYIRIAFSDQVVSLYSREIPFE